MDKTKSTTFEESVATEIEKQVSTSYEGATGSRRFFVNMVQNTIVIWLDSHIDVNSVDGQTKMAELQHVSGNIYTFHDKDQSLDFLTDIDNCEACMIISGALCQNIVPLIHDVTQLKTIFIFSENKNKYEPWAKDWSKIKGVFTDIVSICKALKKAAYQSEQNAIPISIFPSDDRVSSKFLDQLNSSFMYTQIIKEILLTIKFEEKHINEFFDYPQDKLNDNEASQKNTSNFEGEYHHQTPIWWYTSDYLFYSVLNRALRTMDINIIVKMGFFIKDLHHHIQQLHAEQIHCYQRGNLFTVYRGQGMSKVDFDQLINTKSGYLSFNNFLSTSKNREVSLLFAESNASDFHSVGIHFVMTIDPFKSTAPFASVTDVGYYGDAEDEVLFSMHTVFRIHDVKPLNMDHRLFQVDLTLTTNNDESLHVLTEYIRKETFPEAPGWYRLGSILLKIDQLEKAKEVYEILLEQTVNMAEKAPIYHQLGSIKFKQKDYKEALKLFEKALEIYNKAVSPDHPDLAMPYHNIAAVYTAMQEYSKALSFYEKAVAIQQQSLPPNHPDFATSYNNIAAVYYSMSEFSKAHIYSKKAFEIQQQSLPANHPDLASSYGNIAAQFNKTKEYSKALLFYEKALAIRQQSLPPNHLDLASSYNKVAETHYQMNEYVKALMFYEKTLAIQQQSLLPNHPDLAESYSNIGVSHRNMGDCSKALFFYKKALDIGQQSPLCNSSNLAKFHINIGVAYKNLGDYSNALSSYMKALELQQRSLSPNDLDLASTYNNIGSVYHAMREYSKARTFYEHAVDLADRSVPPNRPLLKIYRNNLDLVERILKSIYLFSQE